ncbi:MAG: ATP-binding protein [Bacteroidetes bacterium]|nr:ATP-binding protein [Bacteroidota bacterium]
MAHVIVRGYYGTLLKRLTEKNPLLQVLTGPRQVGKTTLVKQVLQDESIAGFYVTADQVTQGHDVWLETQWQRAVAAASETEKPFCLVVDEVQKIPQWSEIIKRLWDARNEDASQFNLLLMGSSRLLMQQGLSESLMGRFETLYLGHWDLAEMQEAFGVSTDEYIFFGAYPGGAHLIHDPDRWYSFLQDAIVETSLSKDILQMTRIDKPALLRNMFDVGCAHSSRELSYSKILGQLDGAGNTTTLAHYLRLLGSAGLLSGLEKLDKSQIRRRASSPKLQVHNNALLLNKSHEKRFRLHYWRDGNYEVDYVISKGDKITGFEVKTGAKSKLSGLERFKQKFPGAKGLIVGSRGIPVEEFLRTSPENYL